MPVRRALILAACGVLLWGCASPAAGPEVVSLDASSYGAAFDAAVEAARAEGLQAVFRDRRGGIIETEPNAAPTLLEPWIRDGAHGDQRWENTLSNQRRRARFAFTPVAGPGTVAKAAPVERQTPDVLGTAEELPDLTAADGDLELRVQVILERACQPGIRRSYWTRVKTAQARTPGEPTFYWVPVARDEGFERRLLGRVEAALRE